MIPVSFVMGACQESKNVKTKAAAYSRSRCERIWDRGTVETILGRRFSGDVTEAVSSESMVVDWI
jgi:hypothetical protein